MAEVRNKCVSLPTGGVAFTEGARVKMSSGALALAGATEFEIGVIEKTTLASDTEATVRLFYPWTVRCIALSAIAAYATVYRAANGKVNDDSSAGNILGIALRAASGDNSQIEVLLVNQPDLDVS